MPKIIKLTLIILAYIHFENMPNTKSAIRRVRRVKTQTQINRIRKSKYKNAVKEMDLLIKSKEKDKAKKYFSKFQSILMQVAKSGVVSKRTAARKISRVSKKI
jgi:small subunit ribosomal protein S20